MGSGGKDRMVGRKSIHSDKYSLMKYTLLFILAALAVQVSPAQISAKLIRYPDVSDSQITFVYGGDVWLVDKNGGTAVQMTESPGEESWPKFSPAGDEIAYTASYDGNEDVYVMPVKGGIPDRLTFQSHSDRTVDWHPDGNRVLFASNRSSGMTRVRQFYLVDRTGGMPEKLSVPYGELASFSADGSKLAYITKITENYPFKRYRGGLTSDILIYDFETGNVDRITTSTANDGKPVWAGKTVYFLSDRAANMRRNIWAFDTESKQLRQVTTLPISIYHTFRQGHPTWSLKWVATCI